jgi:hypothetical protein
MFGSIDLPALVVILVIALIIFGPRAFGASMFADDPGPPSKGMLPSEMAIVAATSLTLLLALRFAPTRAAETATAGAIGVCVLIYAAYRIRRSQRQ